jgi:integrase/recombinase XerD
LICNLVNGAPIRSEAIWRVLNQLRLRIKRLVETESPGGAITEEQKKQKQKLEYLLRVKKWNPYCFRHSAITDDSDHLPEFALTKKVRWVMGSKQANRYIKHRMGDSLKNEILEHHGIKIANKQPQMVSRMCGRCNYVNKLESKYCERVGCNYPLTQLALDEIKSAEQARLQELIHKSNLAKEQEIDELKNQINEMDGIMNEVVPAIKKVSNELEGYKKELWLYRDMEGAALRRRNEKDSKGSWSR